MSSNVTGRVYRYSLRDPATLLGAATVQVKSFPVKGAKYAIIRMKSTDASDVLSAVSMFAAGYDPTLMFSASNGAVSPYFASVPPTAFQRMDVGEGTSWLIVPSTSNPHMRFVVGWLQPQFTAAGVTPANDISGFEVIAEVFYDDGADELYRQTLAAV